MIGNNYTIYARDYLENIDQDNALVVEEMILGVLVEISEMLKRKEKRELDAHALNV